MRALPAALAVAAVAVLPVTGAAAEATPVQQQYSYTTGATNPCTGGVLSARVDVDLVQHRNATVNVTLVEASLETSEGHVGRLTDTIVVHRDTGRYNRAANGMLTHPDTGQKVKIEIHLTEATLPSSVSLVLSCVRP